ncbi:hypothetical protein [Actinomadura litoris]|uniref:hypothetical protein n=1 Tax=Actinomadura litoris TaxID=2678616 RepID=UPI001FA6E5C7|nr:hypothetical protein [Actinomadura litoris]
MSHSKRAREAAALAGRLEGARVVTDPSPPERQFPLRTAILAWGAAEPGATHHLVVQDDVELSPGFLRRVETGVRLFPDAALAFYANWSSMNGAAIRLAGAAGATWVHEMGTEYFPTLALALPARHVGDFVEFATALSRWWRDDDDVMREFLESRGIDAYVSVPSLVEHRDLESVAGNGDHGERRAAWFTAEPAHDPSYEALAHAINFCPWLNKCRALVLAQTVHDGRQMWIQRPWTDMAAAHGLDAADLRAGFDRLAGGSPRLQKTADDLGELFVFSLWLTSYLMGAAVRAGVPLRTLPGRGAPPAGPAIERAGLHTLAVGGSAWMPLPPSLLATYSAETAELAETGFAAGLTAG